jgi:copper transport protein
MLSLFLMAALAAVPAADAAAATGRQPALLHSDPAQGEETRGLPTSVRLRFNQPMRLERLKVYDSEGVEQVVRLSRDAATPSLEQRGGLIRLRPGHYRAEWAASSPAGETISGTLFFQAKARDQQQTVNQ